MPPLNSHAIGNLGMHLLHSWEIYDGYLQSLSIFKQSERGKWRWLITKRPSKGGIKAYSKYDSVLSLYSLKDLPEYMEDNYHKGSSNVPSSSGSLVDWNFKRQVWIRKTEKRPQKDFLPHAHLLRVECGGGGQSNKGGADSIQRVWDQNIFFLGFYMFL